MAISYFVHIQVGDSTADKTSGIVGSQKQNVMASATPVLTEGVHVWPARTGGDTRPPGSTQQAVQTQQRSGSVTGLHSTLCSLNFKSNEVKPQQITSSNERRLQRS